MSWIDHLLTRRQLWKSYCSNCSEHGNQLDLVRNTKVNTCDLDWIVSKGMSQINNIELILFIVTSLLDLNLRAYMVHKLLQSEVNTSKTLFYLSHNQSSSE